MATDAEIHAAFGERVVALWERRGLSGREVMRRAGLVPSFITRLKHGKGLTLASAIRIAAAVGEPLGNLLDPPSCAQCLGEPPAGFACNACGAGTEARDGQ